MSSTPSGTTAAQADSSRRDFLEVGAAGLAESTIAMGACRTGLGNASQATAAGVQGLVGDARKRPEHIGSGV